MTEKLFAVSVADALLIDESTDTLVVKGTALLSSTMDQALQESEIFAGRGSQLQFTYNYQKVISFTIEAADFSPTYLALQTGSEIKNEMSNYFTEATLEFDAQGEATLPTAPVGKVYVETASNYATTTPTGSVITVASLAGKKAKVSYQHSVMVDKLTIPANSFPKAYKLVLTSDIFRQEGDKAYEQQIVAPRYKLDGALSVGLTHDAVSSFTLSGKTLADDDGNYAYISWLPTGGATGAAVQFLAADPAEVTLAVDAEQAVTVYGIRGGAYSNIVVPTAEATYSSEDATIATYVNGNIKGIAAGNTIVRVTYQGVTDVIKVTVTA